MNIKKKISINWLIYIILVYVCLQLTWWGYNLIDINKQIFLTKSELLNFSSLKNEAYYLKTKQLQHKLNTQRIMVYAEGGIFLILLIFVFIQLRKSILKENTLSSQQKNFLMAVTHELKSPITAIKLQIETLIKRNLNTEQQHTLLNAAKVESNRLSQLVDNILTATAIDEAQYPLNRQELNLSKSINQTVNNYNVNYSKEINFKLNLDESIILYADVNAINSILTNLLDNAIKFKQNEQKLTIHIELYKKTDEIILSISDNGIGIATNEIKNITSKFYRIGNEFTRTVKGSGLGLFIVNYLVNLHNAQLHVKSKVNHGSTFSIHFIN